MPESTTLTERAQYILKVIIERYIRSGQPIGSRTLVEEGLVTLSPATVRNIMAELEDAGYLFSPHTSAGRMPTALGYRFFVDGLLMLKPLAAQEITDLQQQLEKDTDQQGLMELTSTLLSSITRLAGFVTLPRREVFTLRHVEFLSLKGNRILVVLVLNEKEVQNRIINTQRHYSESELVQAANYVNAHYSGKDLQQISEMLLTEMRADQSGIANLMQLILALTDQAFTKENNSPDDYVLAGESNLLNLAEETNLEQMRSLFQAFNHKRDLLHLLQQCLNADGVQIFIGEESGYDALGECSLITAPYKSGDKIVGVLGVIGPTRMSYERIIPSVEITAKLLSAALKEN